MADKKITMEEMLDSYRLDERTWVRGRNAIAAVTLLAWAACAAGFAVNERQFFFSYLVSFVFFATVGIGALFFVMLQHATGAAWSVTMRRVAEDVMVTIPWAAVLFVPVALGLRHLYVWTDPAVVAESHVLQGKQAYLNEPFFIVRTGVYLLLWSIWALVLYRQSVAQDEGTSIERTRAAARWSAPGLVMLTVTACLAAFDWLMSLDPEWYSSIFGVYVYSGAAVAFVAALIVILLAFRRADVLRYSVNEEHYHDLGKWLFGLTVFWAYIGFSQYLLIWYANLPEETLWFHNRTIGNWGYVGAVLVFGNFLAPFLALLSRPSKRRFWLLAAVGAWMLLMHYVDIYWMAMPTLFKNGPQFHWLDAATFLAVGGVFAFAFWAKLRGRALAPLGDVRFERSLEFRNV